MMSSHTHDPSHQRPHRPLSTDSTAAPEEQRASRRAMWEHIVRLKGELILPGDPAYEDARKVWNGAADRSPALIVRCANVEDVIAAVTVAREQKLSLSVRSGGHSLAGHGTNDGGMVIDLSALSALRIDSQRRIAHLEPGLTWGEVSRTLQPSGLVLSAGYTASVGVGGLLLGGGIGWMVRKYGLAIDHLRAVELVTADGWLLRASADENSELFWGLRGGGGNFGIATAFEVDLHPGGTILGGAVFYEVTEVERILQDYARLACAAPDELTTQVVLMPAPPAPFIPPDKRGTPVVALRLCYAGELAEGEQVVAPLRTLGTVIADLVAPMPASALLTLARDTERRGLSYHARSQLFETPSAEMMHALAQAASTVIGPQTRIQLRILGGAMSRVAKDATAFAHRDKEALVVVMHSAPPSADPADLRAHTEQVWQALAPYASGAYVNFLADEGEQGIHEAYPPATYARLAALKRRYDPTNLFHLNQNIKPAEAEAKRHLR
jgi:FAD/FMN-containing dehydrogenase